LKADKITFWSNFDGISSANPSIVKGAQHLPEITYAEVFFFLISFVLFEIYFSSSNKSMNK